ncbi:hypothetical protein BPT24_189 [Tenacibaculum phage pT24]|uniref:Uncharacterized protein n=1 Tax=Tenacibaculum phage pT24 TaxID=1880590 RepID=A0A1B4XWY6_9CAUD|nr:hypothetical protein HYP10_gp189 [Tenacibaculum phage pT24]BAV39314.1 hypothetical protein BPT24_189 [Tenacibaculum phage pT24]
MKRIVERTPKWCYVTLIVLVVMGSIIHTTSIVTKNIIEQKMADVELCKIENEKDFIDLQQYFQNRYGADASLTYILQPKDYIKLYKELVNVESKDSTYLSVPRKSILSKEKKLQIDLMKKKYVRIDSTTSYENNSIIGTNCFKTAYVFPILQHQTHVSEIVFLFNDEKRFTDKELNVMLHEIQALSRYIK